MVSNTSVGAAIGRQGETGCMSHTYSTRVFQLWRAPTTKMPAAGHVVLTLVFSSNRPLGVSIMILGGLKGYSAGNSILK